MTILAPMSTMLVPADSADIHEYARWPAETRAYAYELWALDEAGNCRRVALRLAAEGYGDVPERTVRYWRDADDWDGQLSEAMALAFPQIGRRIASRLMLAADSGSGYLQRVNDGTEAPDKSRVTAALGALDRVGHSPLGRSAAPTIERVEAVVEAWPDFASMSAEERRAWELERREQLRAALRPQTR